MEKKLFSITPNGDPYNKNGWDVHEHEGSFDNPICIFRGDLSPVRGRKNGVATLKRLFPGCEVRVDG